MNDSKIHGQHHYNFGVIEGHQLLHSSGKKGPNEGSHERKKWKKKNQKSAKKQVKIIGTYM